MKAWLPVVLLAGVVTPILAAPKTAAPGYKVIAKIPLPGDGGWDCLTVDSSAQRLYIARSTRVMVVDLKKNALAGEVADTPGVHGVAVVPGSTRAYASDGRDNSVTVFDKTTLKETKRIAVGQNPDVIEYNAATKRIFTFNGRSNDATAIDVTSDKVVGTIALGGKPEFAVSDGKTMYVNLEDKSEIVQFDAKTLKVLNRWSLAPGEGPTGLAINPKTHRLFSTCDGKLIVMDSRSGKVIGSPAIGAGTDGGAFDAALSLAFTPNGGDGTLSVLHEDKDGSVTLAETVPTQSGARTIALDTKTHRVYTVAADYEPLAPGATSRRRAMKPGSFVLLVIGK